LISAAPPEIVTAHSLTKAALQRSLIDWRSGGQQLAGQDRWRIMRRTERKRSPEPGEIAKGVPTLRLDGDSRRKPLTKAQVIRANATVFEALE